MIQYDDLKWIEHFKVGRDFMFQLIEKLTHLMKNRTHYMCVMLIGIQIGYALYKLTHGTKYFHCSECLLLVINYSHGPMKICACSECYVQMSNQMAKGRRPERCDGWV
jgi:hypothetical protein